MRVYIEKENRILNLNMVKEIYIEEVSEVKCKLKADYDVIYEGTKEACINIMKGIAHGFDSKSGTIFINV